MVKNPEHRWSTTRCFLAGMTFNDWWRLLQENRFAVDAVYWHRATFVTLMSLWNVIYLRKERQLYSAAIDKVTITNPPLFILGHMRSGTTHLHNLLAQDAGLFAYPNTYQVTYPRTFLSSEEANTQRFAGLMPKKRPMDNMAMGFRVPQEDEFALCTTCFYSPLMAHVFPRRREHYDRYFTFRDVPPAEVEEWKNTFLWFLKKLTLKYERTLLLKSPPHTARIRLLLEMFPGAHFIHIYRDPYVVFQSTQHLENVMRWHEYLQRPEVEPTDVDYILQRFNLMYDAFFQDRPLIPDGQYHEVCFEELEREPIAQIKQIYEKFDLPGFETFQPKLEAYLRSLAGYKKNKYAELPQPLQEKIAQAWQRNFQEWSYRP